MPFTCLSKFIYKHSVLIDVQEYEGLTNKIHELQLREQELQDQLGNEHSRSPSPTDYHPPAFGGDGDDETVFPMPDNSHDATTPPLTIDSFTRDVTPNNSSGNLLASPQLPPRSPLRNMIKAYLPNQQKTAVSTQASSQT